jgi:hypothetical protein
MSGSDNTSDQAMRLEVVHPNAAGIDIGNAAHYAAVPPDRDAEPVRSFGCFTEDRNRMADDRLEQCGILTVVMQSTGVYWLPVYEILVQRGFEVFLVNARHARNLPGRKSDVQECQWLMKLHSSRSFIAFRIAMPVTPLMSVITLAICTFICVSSFCIRWIDALADFTRSSRCRQYVRNTQISPVGRKELFSRLPSDCPADLGTRPLNEIRWA